MEFENNEVNDEEVVEVLRATEANLMHEKNGVGIGMKTNEVMSFETTDEGFNGAPSDSLQEDATFQ